MLEAAIPESFINRNISRDVVVLVVGQTGAGKSTQIDSMLNYILGVKWAEKVRFKVIDEQQTVTAESLHAGPRRSTRAGETEACTKSLPCLKVFVLWAVTQQCCTCHHFLVDTHTHTDSCLILLLSGAAASQTDAVTAYKIPAVRDGPVNANFTIIDTPGFGDTRGLHFDAKIVDQMKKFFQDFAGQVPSLSAVCFVTQASAARLTESQQYVWDAILSLFGKDIAENIALCFTFADGEKPQALEAVRAGGIPMVAHYKFNNSALFVDPHSPETGAVSKMFWDMGKQSMEEFFHALERFSAKSLHLTQQVLSERETLEVALENLGPQVQILLSKASSLQTQAELFARFAAEMDGSKDFKMKVAVDKFKKKPTSNLTTTCTTCNMTCHQNCAFANDADKARCCVMQNGQCTVCSRRCHWSQHQNLPYILEWYVEYQQVTQEQLKKRYDAANEGKLDKEKVMQGLLNDLDSAHTVLADCLVRTKKCKERLAEIAMRPNAIPSEAYIEIMIENEKSKQQHGWQNRVKVLQKLKKQSELLRDAEDPEFTEKLLKKFRQDQNISFVAEKSDIVRSGHKSKSWYNNWFGSN